MAVAKQSAYFKVFGLHNKHQLGKIKRALNEIPGVLSVSADIQSNQVAVDYDSSGLNIENIANQLQDHGMDVKLIESQDHTM